MPGMAPPATSAAAALRRSQQLQAQPQPKTGNLRQSNPPPATASSSKKQLQQQSTTSTAGPSRLAKQSTGTTSSSREASDMETTSEEEDDDDDDDDDEEEEMALQMDGQDLWTQNYCSVCDCLIEPGQGVGPSGSQIKANKGSRIVDDDPPLPLSASRLPKKNSSATSSVSSGLHSSASTIKSRPPSSEGKLKRNGSSGKLAGAAIRRNGSAGSRLNALSDLKPTTKLNGEVSKPAKTGAGAAGQVDKTSPKYSRRSSAASIASAGTTGSEADSFYSQPSPRSHLPRSKKGGLLGGITPAILKQQQQEEEEASRATAPTALYCSERCREIDQQTSLAGLAEFGFYTNQVSPTWPPESPTQPRGAMPSSLSSLRGVGPPARGSDSVDGKICTCNECQERNSASGTVPSGASDTTEGSGGYPYSRMGAPVYRKQRSQSGRIITPQNLNPPSGGEDGYFPRYAESRRHPSISSTNVNNSTASTGMESRPSPERTASAASGETGRSGTGSSAQSTGSYAEFWEPKLRSSTKAKGKGKAGHLDEDSDAAGSTAIDDRVSQQGSRTRTSTVREQSQGNSQGTVTPAAQGPNSTAVPSVGSLPAGASSLNLLKKQSSSFRSSPSVEFSADMAHSPAFGRPHLAESFASEHTLGSSANTMVQRAPSLRERRKGRGKSLMLEFPDASSHTGSPDEVKAKPNVDVNSAERLSKSYSSPRVDAIDALKAASGLTPATASSARFSPNSQTPNSDDTSERRNSSGATLLSSASSGFLKGLSSAWTAFRGTTPAIPTPTLIVPEDASTSSGGSQRRSSAQLSSPLGRAIMDSSPDGRRGRSSVASNNSGNSGMLSKSAASESLSRIMSNTNLSKSYRGASPSSVARPGVNRGSIPAFAKEIGQGQIPGEPAAKAGPPSPQESAEGSASSPHQPRRNSSALGLTSTGATEEEKRRRRKAEQRHQRSKDVTMLPPLLAPSNRTSSAVSLAQHRSRSGSRSAVAHGNGATFTVGSAGAGSYHELYRPTTPSLLTARARDGARSPEISLNDGAPVVHAEDDATPLPKVSSQQDLYRAGTSPRRSGLGWGAMTPITPHAAHPPTFHQHQPQPQRQGPRLTHHHTSGPPVSRSGVALGNMGLLGHHPHGSQATYGRHNTMPVRTTTPIVPEHGGEMSGAALTGQDVESFYREAAAAAAAGAHARPHSAMSNRRGSYAAAHAHHGLAASSSSSTPALAQHVIAGSGHGHSNVITSGPGGAGSGRPKSMNNAQRSSYQGLVPPSPIRNHFEPLPDRTWSYDNLANASSKSGVHHPHHSASGAGGGQQPGGVRTYSVLTVPGREETHDRYDESWNHVVQMLAGGTAAAAADGSAVNSKDSKGVASAAGPGAAAAAGGAVQGHGVAHGGLASPTRPGATLGPAKRKQLFHFGP
ncbi:hypothetical protein BCV69DRAFT_69103 [Microstroma glucosiphilum]|uniref:Uncharacterized protein n=1 Tax=Pseudomicrostroma glucosiphilum TaxID=1684307 RepID=A0A316U090_9BASI|nr:hypothetical protein BCV69DRAFT_69103 [Pseudomicrostroma glucosiphilum]PWN18640.1 hypothetical protein BCV69DRAFT_69103 [Pseudomicrostroma glucosiphilum]